MVRAYLIPLGLVLALVAASGCGSARLVRDDGHSGVVAIPCNSNSWPYRYREAAEKVMAEKCPNGYDILSEGEVVVGKTATTSHDVNSIPINNGSVVQTTTSTTSLKDEKEYRITYRNRSPQVVPVAYTTQPCNGACPPPSPMQPCPCATPPVISTTGDFGPHLPAPQPVMVAPAPVVSPAPVVVPAPPQPGLPPRPIRIPN